MSAKSEREKTRILEDRRRRVVREAKHWRALAEAEENPAKRAAMLKLADADTARLQRNHRGRRRTWRGR